MRAKSRAEAAVNGGATDPVEASDSQSGRGRRLRGQLLSPEGLVALLALAYIGLMIWWLANDTRVPYGESGKHLFISTAYLDAMGDGHLGAPFYYWETYPPFVHLFGVAFMFLSNYSATFATAALNAVFLPLLLLGCYGAGRACYGRQAGVLAAIFALAVPMMVLLSHMFMLEIPLAALTALSVWFLVASERFARRDYALLAGLAIAAGIMTKATFSFGIVGVGAIMLVRGGWRNWRNALICAGVATAISLPWYAYHYERISSLVGGASESGSPGGLGFSPPSGSVEDLTWYAWNLINNQLFLPLAGLLLTGVVILAVRWVRERDTGDFTPELLAGGAVGYLAHTLISLHDQRYTFPLLVFAAVLATGWVPRVPRAARAVAYAVLATALVVNTFSFTLGSSISKRFSISADPGPLNPVQAGQVVIFNNKGFILNEAQALSNTPQPTQTSDVDAMLEAAAKRGAKRVTFRGETWPDFADISLIVLARSHGISDVPDDQFKRLGPNDLNFARLSLAPGMPPPCATLDDGAGIYVLKGPLRRIDERTVKRKRSRLVCPGGSSSN